MKIIMTTFLLFILLLAASAAVFYFLPKEIEALKNSQRQYKALQQQQQNLTHLLQKAPVYQAEIKTRRQQISHLASALPNTTLLRAKINLWLEAIKAQKIILVALTPRIEPTGFAGINKLSLDLQLLGREERLRALRKSASLAQDIPVICKKFNHSQNKFQNNGGNILLNVTTSFYYKSC